MPMRRANTKFAPTVLATLVLATTCLAAGRGGDPPLIREIEEPEKPVEIEELGTRDGVRGYRVTSGYQAKPTLVRILVPDKLEPPGKRRVLFVLPVEKGLENRFGDGLKTAQKLDVANQHRFVVVAPTFSDLPWYVDHPKDRALRQESHLLEAVVPLVADLYPHEAKHRALLGFSKSGWGAFVLLLRHPEAFGAAVAWDAPFMMTKPSYGLARIVGTQAHFDSLRVPRLLTEHAKAVQGSKRLAHFGYGNFRDHHQQAQALMDRLKIPHLYADGPQRKHHWDGGWVPDAVRMADELLRD